MTPSVAGGLGSYALIGALIGALLSGAVSDIIGRRKVMLAGYAWFSIFMGLTALAGSSTMFGIGRFLTGIGVGTGFLWASCWCSLHWPGSAPAEPRSC